LDDFKKVEKIAKWAKAAKSKERIIERHHCAELDEMGGHTVRRSASSNDIQARLDCAGFA
jgi:hypothetical protein